MVGIRNAEDTMKENNTFNDRKLGRTIIWYSMNVYVLTCSDILGSKTKLWKFDETYERLGTNEEEKK